jgi:hypothetical protein
LSVSPQQTGLVGHGEARLLLSHCPTIEHFVAVLGPQCSPCSLTQGCSTGAQVQRGAPAKRSFGEQALSFKEQDLGRKPHSIDPHLSLSGHLMTNYTMISALLSVQILDLRWRTAPSSLWRADFPGLDRHTRTAAFFSGSLHSNGGRRHSEFSETSVHLKRYSRWTAVVLGSTGSS